MFKICVIIPVYNHGKLLQKNIQKILAHNLPVILVNDGCNSADAEILHKIKAQNPQIMLQELAKNEGKGAALFCGFSFAHKNGFTHALQIDADGQHEISDIPLFVKLAEASPQSLVNGCPFYDKNAPKSRLYGRKITNFWVAIETLSCDIKDAMCGFRVYPLQKTLAILEEKKFSKRMGFDSEIIVRLHWAGVKIINQLTHVDYPEDGLSNFKIWRDNLEISKLHARLFFGMVKRIFFRS